MPSILHIKNVFIHVINKNISSKLINLYYLIKVMEGKSKKPAPYPEIHVRYSYISGFIGFTNRSILGCFVPSKTEYPTCCTC